MKKRVVVAMSGGVDSSVAAALLQEQGYEVIGVTMCFGSAGGKIETSPIFKPSCCGLEGIEDARRVAHKLGIKHYVLSFGKDLEKHVIRDFVREYALGRTPNPCVRCNQFLKFGLLLKKARVLGAEFLATGHYARIVNGSPAYILKKGKDKLKEQSYFLYRLTQAQLKHTLFPLGGYTKPQVRDLARRFNLAVADKSGSQEICFIPKDDYRLFLKARLKTGIEPGDIVDTRGNLLSRHQGIAFYTIGQRQGLGIARGYPVYITGIDAQSNRIIIGKRQEALKKEFLVTQTHLIRGAAKKKIASQVKIRYNHRQAPAVLEFSGNKVRVKFRKAQFAITPGQAAVFYDKDTVLGGGIIDKVLD